MTRAHPAANRYAFRLSSPTRSTSSPTAGTSHTPWNRRRRPQSRRAGRRSPPDRTPATVGVEAALDLVGRGGRAPEKSGREELVITLSASRYVARFLRSTTTGDGAAAPGHRRETGAARREAEGADRRQGTPRPRCVVRAVVAQLQADDHRATAVRDAHGGRSVALDRRHRDLGGLDVEQRRKISARRGDAQPPGRGPSPSPRSRSNSRPQGRARHVDRGHGRAPTARGCSHRLVEQSTTPTSRVRRRPRRAARRPPQHARRGRPFLSPTPRPRPGELRLAAPGRGRRPGRWTALTARTPAPPRGMPASGPRGSRRARAPRVGVGLVQLPREHHGAAGGAAAVRLHRVLRPVAWRSWLARFSSLSEPGGRSCTTRRRLFHHSPRWR